MTASLRLMPVLTGLALTLVTLTVADRSQAQDALSKRDQQGAVTVVVTLLAPPASGVPVRVKVVLDTHSANLDGVAFDAAVAIRGTDGADTAPSAVEQVTGSGHHREAVLVFPAIGPGGSLRIVVKNVGGVPERTFTWPLPSGG